MDKFDSATFRKLANDNNLYEHLENIAGEECSVQKTFLRLDCYDIYRNTNHYNNADDDDNNID